MFKKLHGKKNVQLGIGLLIGILFGIFLQKGRVTRYDVIMGQLLLEDFTVIKVMLTAIVTGKVGVHLLKSFGKAELHPKAGSFGSTVIGGLLFGIGFGILGYCPGTLVGAIGQGSLDAFWGGMIGLLVGVAIFAEFYPALEKKILLKWDFGDLTFPQLLKVNPWMLVIPLALGILALLIWIESSGL